MAQNHLYSTEQFGIDGAMLGGAITAGSDDVSMTYYNPAAIHKVSPQLSISFIQPSIRSFGFDNFWNNNSADAVNNSIDLKPSLVSFKTRLGNFEFAFLKLTKSQQTDHFSTKLTTGTMDQPSTQYFDYEYSGEDDWYGIGTNFQIAENQFIGLSHFVSLADYTYDFTILLEQSDPSVNGGFSRYFNSVFEGEYSNVSFITKVGWLLDTDKHDVGVAITSPTYLRLRKGGELYSTSNIINQGDISLSDIIADDMSPIIKTPWEIDIGYSLDLKTKGKLWVNTSYHSAIRDYEMANLDEVSPGYRWLNGSVAVWNIAFAYAYEVNEKLALSFGARTNQFAYENKGIAPGTQRNVILDEDQMHYVLGAKFQFHRNTILVGLDYGTIGSNSDIAGFDNFSNIDVLSPNLTGFQKTNLSFLFTYGFIIDEIRSMSR
ncbi:MAG: hypothetical protein AAFQ94_15400 [Bacteroidota bacterium]